MKRTMRSVQKGFTPDRTDELLWRLLVFWRPWLFHSTKIMLSDLTLLRRWLKSALEKIGLEQAMNEGKTPSLTATDAGFIGITSSTSFCNCKQPCCC